MAAGVTAALAAVLLGFASLRRLFDIKASLRTLAWSEMGSSVKRPSLNSWRNT